MVPPTEHMPADSLTLKHAGNGVGGSLAQSHFVILCSDAIPLCCNHFKQTASWQIHKNVIGCGEKRAFNCNYLIMGKV